MKIQETSMKSKTSKILAVALVCFANTPNAFSSGDKVGGGGNACLLKLEALLEDVQNAADRLASLQSAGINASDFKNTLAKAKFQVGEGLTKDGAPVDALNFPEESLITVDKDTCGAALGTLNDGMSLLVHETLGLMKADDTGYRISKNVLNELSQIVVKKPSSNWNFVCAVKRYHYSSTLMQRIGVQPGGSGFEILALLSVVHSESGHLETATSASLYGRTDHETDEYSVAIDVSRGPWEEHEPRLMYNFARYPNRNSSMRETLTKQDWDEVKFDQYGRANIRLLDGSAFSDGQSFLEMDCFSSM
jgi:hypothetical protein